MRTSTLHPLDQALALTPGQTPDHYRGQTTQDYWNMVGPYGGITAAVLLRAVPDAPPLPAPDGAQHHSAAAWHQLWRHTDLLRLNLGVFVLHLVQTAMWVAVPVLLVRAGLDKPRHWQMYLPTVLASCALLMALFALERRKRLRLALLGAIALVAAAQAGFGLLAAGTHPAPLWALALCLWIFFCGFNVLEASQPSLVSRLAPPQLRGAAMGAYGTLQSLGLFAGGALGGALAQWAGLGTLFATTTALALLWLALTWPLRPGGR